ncbi:hypothetical protein ACS0TY_021649 [Phlomoides rotata]
MDAEPLLSFEPSELSFPFELNKQLSSSIRLLNKTNNYVAFKLLSTNPRKYVVRPRIGILLPGSTRDISVTTTRVLRDAPQNMRCKDKFMIRSAVATPSATLEDAPRMFDREAGHSFHEWILRVIYSIPTESSLATSDIENPDSHVPEATDSVMETHGNDLQTSTRKLLDVQPPELQLPSSLNKELSCSIQLSNVTDHHVAFRVKTASSKYFIEPDVGILLPQSKCDITAKKQVESKVPYDIQNEDKLLIQSVVAPAAATTENISMDLFDKENSHIEECELKVVYISGQENNNSHNAELILRNIISGLLVLVSMYLMKQTLSWIWSLTMILMMLMIKMVKKLVSDSVEDWIVKTLLYIFMHILFGRKDNISLS